MAAPRNVKPSKRPVLCEKCGEAYDRKNKSDIFCPECKAAQPEYSQEKTCQRCKSPYQAWSKFRTGVNYCGACAEIMRLVNLSITMDKAKTIHNAPRMIEGNRRGNSTVFVTTV